MPISRLITIVSAHCAGEVCDVITGGVPDVPPSYPRTSMYDKMAYFRDTPSADSLRHLLLNEPRGRPAMCMNLILPPVHKDADAGFIIMESEEYPAMSGGNLISVVTVLLETGMLSLKPSLNMGPAGPENGKGVDTRELKLDTPAGLVSVSAEIDTHANKCVSVSFDNVPAFVFALDFSVHVPGLGDINVDVAWGGMIYVLVDVSQLNLDISICNKHGPQLISIGERIKRAVQEVYVPVHPDNADIQGVTILEFTEPLVRHPDGTISAVNTVVVSPGRFDRCPCGTGSCARMAVLHARGELGVGEVFQHRSIIGSEFSCHINGTTKVGAYDAVLPTVRGSAWVTGYKQTVLDSTDPFPVGFRVGDLWHQV